MSSKDGRDGHGGRDKCATHDSTVSAEEAADIGINEQVTDAHVDMLVKNTIALMNAMHARTHNTKPLGMRFARTLVKLSMVCDAWNGLAKCPITADRMKEIDDLCARMDIKNPLYADPPTTAVPIAVFELDNTSKSS